MLDDGGNRRARCGHDRAFVLVAPDAAERLEVEDHRVGWSLGRRHQARVAALGHDIETRFGGELHHGHDLVDRDRPDYTGGLPSEPPGPVDGITRHPAGALPTSGSSTTRDPRRRRSSVSQDGEALTRSDARRDPAWGTPPARTPGRPGKARRGGTR